MRELVLATGVDLRNLLWSTTVARWWTIGWSIVLLMPLVAFAITLGGVSNWQLQSAACGLILLAALTAGMGMLCSLLMANSKNLERATSSATMIGLLIYDRLFATISAGIYFFNTIVLGDLSPSLDLFCSKLAALGPGVNLHQSMFNHLLFEPSSPGYWFHFFTAAGCAALATLLVDWRFKSSPTLDTPPEKSPVIRHKRQVVLRPKSKLGIAFVLDSDMDAGGIEESEGQASSQACQQRRCTNHPFFWKDVQILSDERKWLNSWSVLYWIAALGFIMLCFYPKELPFRTVVVAIGSLAWIGLITALRFDALLTTEFRDRTWGTLMLLPVDPVEMLHAKFYATVWEQRYAAVPAGLSLAGLFLFAPYVAIWATGIVAAYSAIICLLLCQMSCINQFLGKAWWVGPSQIVGCIALIIVTVFIGAILGDWAGAIGSALFLLFVAVTMQLGCIHPLARDWIED